MTRLLFISDDGTTTGYGRISMALGTGLVKRGYEFMAASLTYDGLLPPTNDGVPLPYHVASLAGHPNWVDQVVSLVNAFQPDIIAVVQDAPYAQAVQSAPIDWSRYGFMVITPVDGKPVFTPWIDMLKRADGTMSISQFGVDAHREAGVASELCRPGINPDVFFPLSKEQRLAIREQLGIAPDAFVLGTCAQNQGRKDYPHMLEAFFKFAADKPNARYLINADPQSPAGWDLHILCQMNGWDVSRLIFRKDCEQRGIHELRERYNVMDAHVVLAHREGFGLPLVEAQACGVVSMALDWCSGTEICANGCGVLLRPIDYTSYSTWGNALDKHVDVAHFVAQLQHLYEHPAERVAIAERGMQQARQWTWTPSVDNTVKVIERIMDKRRALPTPMQAPQIVSKPASVPQSVDGMHPAETVELVEAGA